VLLSTTLFGADLPGKNFSIESHQKFTVIMFYQWSYHCCILNFILNFVCMSYVLSLRHDFPAKKDWNEYVKNAITTLERKFLLLSCVPVYEQVSTNLTLNSDVLDCTRADGQKAEKTFCCGKIKQFTSNNHNKRLCKKGHVAV